MGEQREPVFTMEPGELRMVGVRPDGLVEVAIGGGIERNIGSLDWYDANFDAWHRENGICGISPAMVKPELGFRWLAATAPGGRWARFAWCVKLAVAMWRGRFVARGTW